MNQERCGLLKIHLAVVLFGMAGVLGKLVLQPPLVIVLARTLLAFFSLGLILAFTGRLEAPGWNKYFGLQATAGLLLALHWWTFFKSVQVSTVAVGLLAYSSFPVFTTVLEPFFFREPFRKRDGLTAAGVSLGLVMIVWPYSWGDRVVVGTGWGIVSGLLFSILSLLNRKLVTRTPAITVAFYQNGFAALAFVLPAVAGKPILLSTGDILGLVLLGVVCTALAHALFIGSLQQIRVQLAGVIASLEPVYGAIFALLLASEVPGKWTIAGGTLIVGTTMVAMYWREKSIEERTPNVSVN